MSEVADGDGTPRKGRVPEEGTGPRPRSLGARRPGALLAVLCGSQLVLAIDTTIITIANASVERALHFSPEELQWTVTAYALMFGGFLLVGGRIGDLFGKRRSFVFGIAAFTAASLGAAASQSPLQLIVCRGAQGLSAAVVSPAALSLLAATFADGPRRQRAFGFWAGSAALGGVVGYFLGGVLTTAFGWRSIFLINGPVGLVAASGAVAWLPRDLVGRIRRKLDLPGAVTVTASLTLLIYGLNVGQSNGWTAPRTVGIFAGSVVLLVVFVLIERRTAAPLLPLRLLRRRGAWANLAVALQASVVGGTVFLESLYLQQVFHYSPAATGTAILPLPAGVTLGAAIAPSAIARFGTRRVASTGLVLVAISTAWLAHSAAGSYGTSFLPMLPVFGFGISFGTVSLLATATAGITPVDQGIVAGLFNMSNQMGAAVGLALLVTIATARIPPSTVHRVAAEAAGIRVAFAVAAGVALASAAIVATVLRRSSGESHDSVLPPPTASSVAVIESGGI